MTMARKVATVIINQDIIQNSMTAISITGIPITGIPITGSSMTATSITGNSITGNSITGRLPPAVVVAARKSVCIICTSYFFLNVVSIFLG